MWLKEVLTENQFADSPVLSDKVLLPVIAQGGDLKLVAGFLPSYLSRLITDIATSPEVEPGKIEVTFCVPGGGDRSDEEHFASLLMQSRLEMSLMKDFVINSLKVLEEGGLELRFLISDTGGSITHSCVGLVSDTGEQNATFIDQLAGDNNSSIKFSRSWVSGSEEAAGTAATGFIQSAVEDTWAGIRNISGTQALGILRRLATQNLLTPINSNLQKPTEAAPVIPSLRDEVDLDEQEDPDEFDELGAFDPEAEFLELQEILEFAEDSEFLLTSFINFPGESVKDLSWFLDDPDRLLRSREHAPPLPSDVHSIVGASTGTCWCGMEFDRRFGCSE